jgi:uncharacterized protein YjbJ (UPF0337 family)
MRLNEDIVKGKWKDFKGEVQKAWGNLTGDELEQTKGNLTSIGGLIQKKYGHTKEEISEKLEGIYNKFSDDAKNSAQGTTEKVKNDLKADQKNKKNF